MNLIEKLNQFLPAQGTDLSILKPIRFTLESHIETSPVYTTGDLVLSFRITEKRALNGEIEFYGKDASKALEDIRNTRHTALEYNDATLVLKNITIVDLKAYSGNRFQIDYIAEGVLHYKKGIKPYVHTLTPTH